MVLKRLLAGVSRLFKQFLQCFQQLFFLPPNMGSWSGAGAIGSRKGPGVQTHPGHLVPPF